MIRIITGTLLEKMLVCEMQAWLYYVKTLETPVKPRQGKARRASLLALDLVGPGRYRLVRRRFEGSVNGVAASVTPEIAVLEGDRIVGFARSRIRGSLRIYRSDYGPLYLASYLAGLEYPKLAVVVVENASYLVEAIKYIVEKGLRAYATDHWRIEVRIADPGEINTLVERAARLVSGAVEPRPSRSARICMYCPFRSECPHYSEPGRVHT